MAKASSRNDRSGTSASSANEPASTSPAIAMGVAARAPATPTASRNGLRRASRVGQAVVASGDALDGLSGLPLLSDTLDEPSDRIREAGRSAVASGRSSGENVDQLSVLLAISIALIPTFPVVCLYLPLRATVVRERRTARALAAEAKDDPASNSSSRGAPS